MYGGTHIVKYAPRVAQRSRVAQCSDVWCRALPCSAVLFRAVRCGVVSCCALSFLHNKGITYKHAEHAARDMCKSTVRTLNVGPSSTSVIPSHPFCERVEPSSSPILPELCSQVRSVHLGCQYGSAQLNSRVFSAQERSAAPSVAVRCRGLPCGTVPSCAVH